MKVTFIFMILVYVSLLLESTWCIHCSFFSLHLDTIPALICWLALKSELTSGLAAVIIAGFLSALFSWLPFYIFPVSYLIAFITAYFVRANFLELTRVQAYLLTGFISIEILVFQLAGSGNPELLWPWEMVQAFINMLVSPVVFWICDKNINWLTHIEARFKHAD